MDIGKLTLILRIKMVYLSGESQEKAFEKAIEINKGEAARFRSLEQEKYFIQTD